MPWFFRKQSADALEYIKQKLGHNSDVVHHEVKMNDEITCTFIYIETITRQKMVREALYTPLLSQTIDQLEPFMQALDNGLIFPIRMTKTDQPDSLIASVLDGQVGLVIKGQPTMYLFPLTYYQNRSVERSENEPVLVGPQEAFIEDIQTNLSLLRHRIKNSQFKITKQIVGNMSKTQVCILYIEGYCDPKLLKHVEQKIQTIDTDSIAGISHVAEYLEETPSSPFPTFQYSERPDTVISSLIEGRISIMVDGTPMSIIIPVTFFSLMQSAEDYYQLFMASTWIRWIRYLFVVISFLLPSLYVAITMFHPEMIPPTLLITIAAARENIPFPTLIEALMMEITFEGLREAGIRIPKPIGETISIIGAIVIGQAAVQAGFVSAPMVIIVSITGIASFIIPHFELGLALRLLRFPIMILGGTLGLFGVIIGVFLIFWHTVTLESFGQPYMQPLAPFHWKQWRDIFIRAPFDHMHKANPYGKKKGIR